MRRRGDLASTHVRVHRRARGLGDRHAAGTGLGLTITHGVISAHGGTVEVLDGPDGVGTVMRITLPGDEQQSVKGVDDAADTGY